MTMCHELKGKINLAFCAPESKMENKGHGGAFAGAWVDRTGEAWQSLFTSRFLVHEGQGARLGTRQTAPADGLSVSTQQRRGSRVHQERPRLSGKEVGGPLQGQHISGLFLFQRLTVLWKH